MPGPTLRCRDRCAPAAPSLLKSRLGWPRCLTCVCASASCIARAHAHRVQRKRLRRAGQRRQMLTCCCREARARWLQMRHSSRLYALLPGSTPSLRPCHAPPKLRGLRGLGGCGRAGSPQLLREGRGRLQARLTDREALVDRHARSFRRVLLRAARARAVSARRGRWKRWSRSQEGGTAGRRLENLDGGAPENRQMFFSAHSVLAWRCDL